MMNSVSIVAPPLSSLIIGLLAVSTSNGDIIHQFEHAGHTYQIWGNGAIDDERAWTAASTFATGLTVNGTSGYLARIDDSLEDAAIFSALTAFDSSFSSTVADGGGSRYAWIGASDLANEDVWTWANNDEQFWQSTRSGGIIAGGNAVNSLYSNWGSSGFGNEPDDFGVGQDAAAIGIEDWPIGSAGQWNDINNSNVLPFIVEFDAVDGETPDVEIIELTPNKSEGSATVRFSSVEGRSYAIHASTNLIDWQPIGNTIGLNGTTTFTEAGIDFANNPTRFYRIENLLD